MGDTILIRRGTLANLPDLQPGEPGWAEDANQLFIGTGTGSAASAMPIGDYDWCPESFTQASIETTLALIGTVNKATLLIRPGTWPISSNADWSAYGNVTFKVAPGAVLSHGAFTLHFANTPAAGPYQIFSGTGLVSIDVGEFVLVEWWGALNNGTGATATTAAFNAAQKTNIVTKLLKGTYLINDYILIDKTGGVHNAGIIGAGKYSSMIQTSATATDGIRIAQTSDVYNLHMRDFALVGTATNTNGVVLGDESAAGRFVSSSEFQNVLIQNFTGVSAAGVKFNNWQQISFIDCGVGSNWYNLYFPAAGAHHSGGLYFVGSNSFISSAVSHAVYVDGSAVDVTFKGTAFWSNAGAGIYASANASMLLAVINTDWEADNSGGAAEARIVLLGKSVAGNMSSITGIISGPTMRAEAILVPMFKLDYFSGVIEGVRGVKPGSGTSGEVTTTANTKLILRNNDHIWSASGGGALAGLSGMLGTIFIDDRAFQGTAYIKAGDQTFYSRTGTEIMRIQNTWHNWYMQTLTASGVITANVVGLNHATVIIAATLAAPTAGQREIIINTSASGTAAHTVTLPAGVTFDGTNNTATLNAPGEALDLMAISATRWFIIQNIGAVALSSV